MNDTEILQVLNSTGAALSDWLQKNFDPYVAIVITDKEVKIVRTEYGVPIPSKKLISEALRPYVETEGTSKFLTTDKGLAMIAAIQSGLLPEVDGGWDDTKFHLFWKKYQDFLDERDENGKIIRRGKAKRFR